jgi:hypothetical protein
MRPRSQGAARAVSCASHARLSGSRGRARGTRASCLIAALVLALCSTWHAVASAQVDATRAGLTSSGLCGIGLTGYPTCPKRIGLSATGSYGYTESVGPVDGAHQRVAGSLGVGAVALPWLAVALRFDGRLDLHPSDSRGKDLTGTGDPRLFVRGGHAVARDVSLGGEAVVWFPGNVAPSYKPRATTVDLKALVAWTPHTLPLSLLGYVGYRLDQSAASAPDVRRLRAGDRVALSLSDSDAVLLAVGASTRAVRDSELFAEIALDYLVGDKAPPFAKSPLRGTLGGRYFITKAVQGELSATVAFNGRASLAVDAPLVPLEPRFLLNIGVRYGYDPYVPPPEPSLGSEQSVDEPSKVPETARVSGTLVDADAAPLPDVRVTLTVLGESGPEPMETVTDGDGTYRFDGVPVGAAQLEATAPGFETQQWTLQVAPKMAPEARRPLTRKGNLGTLRLLTRTFASEPLASVILIKDQHGKKVASGKADEQGLFEFDLPPGRYVVMISAPGYRPHRGEVQIERHGVAILNVDMREQK